MDLVFRGHVERGEGMARNLGCPTANVAVEQGAIIPGLGIYVGETELAGVRYPSLVCINDGRTGYNLKMEVHLLGVEMDLLGKYLKVTLFEKIRDLIPFPGEEEMAKIIKQDLEKANVWFQTRASGPVDENA
ncbi:riboflavin kinase [Candidatus Uhrbacteria bacterium]|nr:riboflavin kinase [Candidatus Uhrbacteria bacterium]